MSDYPTVSTASNSEHVPCTLALVVDGMADVRNWLEFVLQQTFDKIGVVKAGSLAEARAWLSSASSATIARVRLALIDPGLPDGSGVGLIAELAESHPGIVPVVSSVSDDDAHLVESIAAGAQGYLLKDKDAPVLVEYLLRIERGEPPLSPGMARRIMAHFHRLPTRADAASHSEVGLTARETEVLGLLGSGASISETASRLGLIEHTIASYVEGLYRKLRASSRPATAEVPATGWQARLRP